MSIIDRINKRLTLLENAEPADASWKDPSSGDYDRQKAEDALFHTIGPLTDNPRWVDRPWSSPGEPVPGYVPGGPAPQWEQEELIMAYAGDPSLLFRGNSDNPKSPAYGNKGGAPLYRLARRVARFYNKDKDRSFIMDLYQNGFVPLVQMMQPGFDESREPFVSYVTRNVQSAMEHGFGGTTATQMAGGDTSTYYTNPEGQMRKRRPSGASDEGWTEHTAVGVKGLLNMTDPQDIRNAAEVVQGKYQNQRSTDKHPHNPFLQHSTKYYQLANMYADALESGEEDRIEGARQQLTQLGEEIEDASISVRGASSGLGQAISTPDRSKDRGAAARRRMEKMEIGDTTTIDDIATGGKRRQIVRQGEDEFSIDGARMSLDDAVAQFDGRGVDVSSIDAAKSDDEASRASFIVGDDDRESPLADSETIKYVLDIALNYDLGTLLKGSKWEGIAGAFSTKAGKKGIGGRMTVNELRYIIRTLGPLGTNYPGRGYMRENTETPRDTRGWWQVGEDPEIEPIPEGGKWTSIWLRGSSTSMQPSEIAQEMTEEVKEFKKLGIPTGRTIKQKQKKRKKAGKVVSVKEYEEAVSNIAILNAIETARTKLYIIVQIHSDQLGVQESVKLRNSGIITESMDQVDRMIIAETARAIMNRLTRAIILETTSQWKGFIAEDRSISKLKSRSVFSKRSRHSSAAK